jgi:uncharacterized protein YndB with AHSA1/START domain
MQTDRIEKTIELNASAARVWRAITDAKEFGTWFRMALDGDFEAGKPIRGRITHKGYEHLSVEMWIEKIDPQRYFSLRWHPYAIDPKVDYSSEPTTLVEFRLESTGEKKTHLTIVESGFDRVPLERRAEAFRMNDGGWTAQLKKIEDYVAAG